MAKPIFIVGFPISADPTALSRISEDLNYKLSEDYHVLTYRASKIEEISFEVLNAVNATDVEILELKQKIKEEIELLLLEKEIVNQTLSKILPKNND